MIGSTLIVCLCAGRGTGISRSNLNVIEDDPHLHFANELTLNDKGDKVLASAVSVDEENAANEGAAALQGIDTGPTLPQ